MRRGQLFLLIALLLLASLLSARWLTYDLPFVDEWWSIFKSGGDVYGPLSPAGIIDRIVTVDPGGMGAGYYLLLGGWEALAGSTPFAVRVYSLLFGVVAIAMTYRIGASLYWRQIGLAAAALMASSAFFLNFMHEARAYTQVTVMACCAVYFYWRLLRAERPAIWQYAALMLSLAGLAYSHYVALSVAAVIAVYHVAFVPKNTRWIRALLAMAAGGLLYLPWLPVIAEVARRGAGDVNRQADSMTAGQAVETLAQAFSNGSPALLALLLAAAAWAVLEGRADRTGAGRLVPLWLIVGLAVALLVNALVPFLVHLRYLIFLWPALAIAAGAGAVALARRGVPLALILGVWVTFGVFRGATLDFNRGLFGEIYRAPAAGVYRATEVLRDLMREDDLVLFHIQQPGFEPFGLFIEDYLTRRLPGGATNSVPRAQTELMNNSFAETDAAYRADVLTILGGRQRVWIVDVPEVAESQRTRTLMDTLAEAYSDCGTALERDDASLRLFTRRPDLDAVRERPQHQYGDETTGFARLTVLPNVSLDTRFGIYQREFVSLNLGWLVSGRLRGGTHSVAVHVVDINGNVIGQDDYPLPTGQYGCRLSVLDARLPDGYYTLYVTVYDWQTLEPLPVAGYSDGRIPVDSFLVSRE